MRYILLFPCPNDRDKLHGATSGMLDYIMGELPEQRSYCPVYNGSLDPALLGASNPGAVPFEVICEKLWQRHNEGDNMDGDRPRAREIRSMCIGDILLFPDAQRTYVADRVGFREIPCEERKRIRMKLD